MDLSTSALWLTLVAAVIIAAALGRWHDHAHRPRRERLLAATDVERSRARTMSRFYTEVAGAEA